MPEILLRPHEEAYIKAHREELKRFSGMDLVFEARMRFMEMPVADREKLAPHWMEEDQPLWQPGSIPLSAVIDEEPEAQPSVRLIEPLPPLQLVAPEPEPAQPAEEPAPEPSSAPRETAEPEFALNVFGAQTEEPAQLDVRSILERSA
ncbi:unnamed protein product [Effrenium voratum]|uniref:Uncharacterized protein n=1 Tax=Effrenium voratum TaxID=2562239 RepID=A0AA36NLP5_9DINO|nr:unnamed protein product [Effrenium voratum]CAJ1422652.1 unnamed protein product [Effrenium voratum]